MLPEAEADVARPVDAEQLFLVELLELAALAESHDVGDRLFLQDERASPPRRCGTIANLVVQVRRGFGTTSSMKRPRNAGSTFVWPPAPSNAVVASSATAHERDRHLQLKLRRRLVHSARRDRP